MEYKEETKICQNCKNEFTIEPDDFNFYEKIKVPPPTWCPECRMIRRFASTNERSLYKRKCDLTGEDIFSMYPENTTFPVYRTEEWYSDKWDPYQYGVEYDFSRTFFEQFMELQNKVPRMALVRQGMSVNSPYTHRVNDMKNSYMVFRGTRCTDSMYLYIAKDTLDCVDCFEISDCELCYECIDCDKCYKVRFSQESKDCRDSLFLYGCRNCSDCVGCVNLVNQQHCIFNKKYSPLEYQKKLAELKLNSNFGIEYLDRKFKEFRKDFPQKATITIKSEKVSGNWFLNCKNVEESFWCINVKDGKYLFSIFDAQDCMDYFQWGNTAEQVYESENCGINISRIFFCTQCWVGAHDLYYCHSCPGSSNCFGCIGLKKGEYAILNKKYSKEEYFEMIEKIKQQMLDLPYTDKKGIVYKFGEHFPNDLADFPYNETAAADFFPATKEEILEQGYRFKDKEKRNYSVTKKGNSLPETIAEVADSILNEVIECAEKENPYSVGAFRVTQNELNFYRRMDLPLPRVCFDVRHMRRLAKRPLPRLQERNCNKCNITVKTIYPESYAPIIYCEKCYQQEVY